MKTLQETVAAAQRAMAGGPTDIAADTVAELDNLRPLDLPELPYVDPELHRHLTGQKHVEMSESQRSEYGFYRDAVSARRAVISENERRLRTALWTEQQLRKAGRPEAALVRTFNLEEWGIDEPAAHGCDAREAVVRMSIGRRRPRFVSMRPQLKPVVPANDQRRGDPHDHRLPIRCDPAR